MTDFDNIVLVDNPPLRCRHCGGNHKDHDCPTIDNNRVLMALTEENMNGKETTITKDAVLDLLEVSWRERARLMFCWCRYAEGYAALNVAKIFSDLRQA